jgi:hypothetical protein
MHKLAERTAMVCRDRVETTRVAVAVVAGEGESGSSDDKPALGRFSRDVNNEPSSARIAGSCSCCVHVLELSFESSAHKAYLVADAAACGVTDARRHQRRESRRRRRSWVQAPRAQSPTADATAKTMILVTRWSSVSSRIARDPAHRGFP